MGNCKKCGKEVQLDEAKFYGEHAYSPCCWGLLVTPDEYKQAKAKAEATRQKRNQANRERYAAMTMLGLKRTPYGWE